MGIGDNMDLELDLALEAARPPVAERTPGVERAIVTLLDAAVPVSPVTASPPRRTGRRRARAMSSALAAVAIVGGAAAAHAAGWLLPQPEDGRSWDDDSSAVRVDVTLPGGKSCEAVYMVVPVETKAAATAPAVGDEVWSAAKDYLDGVDPGDLTSPEVVASYRAEELAARRLAARTLPADEVPPAPTEDEIRVTAPGAALKRGLDARLRELDLPTDLLVMTSGDNCSPGARE